MTVGPIGNNKTFSLMVSQSPYNNDNKTLELFILPKDSPIHLEGQLSGSLTAERINEMCNEPTHFEGEVRPDLPNHLKFTV